MSPADATFGERHPELADRLGGGERPVRVLELEALRSGALEHAGEPSAQVPARVADHDGVTILSIPEGVT